MIDDFIKNNSSYNNKKYGRIKQREQLRYQILLNQFI